MTHSEAAASTDPAAEPSVSGATGASYADSKEAFEEWKKQTKPELATEAQKDLWGTAKQHVIDFIDECMKFTAYHSRKIMKFQTDFLSKQSDLAKQRHSALMEEIKSLKAENKKLRADNQSLTSTTHTAANAMHKKNDDLKVGALVTCARVYAEKKKVGVQMFNDHGFGISHSILTKDVRSIKKARDFGPNSSKGGRPFFNGLFKELSKCPADTKLDGMANVKNHELVYSDVIDQALAKNKNDPRTGHPLDTPDNRAIIWYGSDVHNNEGVACQVIKAFNGKRSDESSKKIRPAIGTLFQSVLQHPSSDSSTLFQIDF